jgi:hypothetical protein
MTTLIKTKGCSKRKQCENIACIHRYMHRLTISCKEGCLNNSKCVYEKIITLKDMREE